MNRSAYILLAIAGALALIVIIVAATSFMGNSKNDLATEQAISTPTPILQAEPVSIHYATSSSEKMLDLLKNRGALSQSDTQIRSALINISDAGYLYSSANARLEYLSSPDQFSSEILSSNVASAKNEIVQFLSSKGLSNEGICALPVIFYLSLQARRSLPANYEFNPLPDNC